MNISSIAGLRAIPKLTSYCISKAALAQFTKCCALDLAPKGIRVNAINPAAVQTQLIEGLGLTREQAIHQNRKLGQGYPLGRVGEVQDTSAAIAYLASDQASFLTGVLLPIDGGAMVAGVY